MPAPDSQMLIYQPEDGRTRIDVRLEEETVWLSQAQLVALFQTSKQNISLHIRNIFSEGELEENSVVKEYLTTAADGKDYRTKHYNLDVIIAVGYRVRSPRGTQFRRWAIERLREYWSSLAFYGLLGYISDSKLAGPLKRESATCSIRRAFLFFQGHHAI